MTDKTKTLQNTVRKLSHQHGRHWGGCLTPTEFLALAPIGATCDKQDIDRAKQRQAQGLSSPWWLYFDVMPGSQLERLLRERG